MTQIDHDEKPERPPRNHGWRRPETAVALVGSGALILAWWLLTEPRPYIHIDHAAFLRTIEYQKGGASYYWSMQEAFHDIGASIGHPRGFRLPLLFTVWRWIPTDALFPVFLVAVVGGTAVLATKLCRSPIPPIAVTGYMLMAGRSLGGYGGEGVESWMLVELWLVPFVVGCVVAWRAERYWLAAACALAAILIRETSAVLLLGGLLASVIERRPWRPWATAAAAAAAAFVAHVVIANRYSEPPGSFAQLFGTGSPPDTIWKMIGWTVIGSAVAAFGLWALGAWVILRSEERWLLLPLLCMPLNGILVDRPYWGIFLVPLLIAYGFDAVLAPFSRSGGTSATGDAGSSLRLRTRRPGRGSPEAAPAPPCG